MAWKSVPAASRKKATYNKKQQHASATAWLQENLSYWSRRRAAENKVSSVAMARTVYTCASLVKASGRDAHRQADAFVDGRVMVWDTPSAL